MAYPSTTNSVVPFSARFGKPYMNPSKYIKKPPAEPRQPRIPPGASYVEPTYPKPSGLSVPSNIVIQPGKSIDIKMQNYYASKARLKREMEFTRALLQRSYATTQFADKLIAGRELMQEALNIRNQIRGLAFPQAMNLARDENERRRVGMGVSSGLNRNDVNAAIRQGLPMNDDEDTTVDDEMLPQGGFSGAKGQALSGMGEEEEEETSLADAVGAQLAHLAEFSEDQELARDAGVLGKEVEELAQGGVADKRGLDQRVQRLDLALSDYIEDSQRAGQEPMLSRQSQLMNLANAIRTARNFAADYRGLGKPIPRRLGDRFGLLKRRYQSLVGGKVNIGTLTRPRDPLIEEEEEKGGKGMSMAADPGSAAADPGSAAASGGLLAQYDES